MKTLIKVTVATAAVAATVVAVRRYDLLNKGADLVTKATEKANEGAEWLTAKATSVTNQLLTEYDNATSDTTEDPANDDAPRGRTAGQTTYHFGGDPL